MSTEYLDSSGLTTLWTQIRAADAAVLTSANNDRTIIETYNLPSLTASSSTSYDILTSKSAVTIAQGGTGATSASAARTNLGLGTMATEAASDYLPISGKAVGIKTSNTAGYETDTLGYFQHQRTTNTDTWAIKTNSGTSSFYVNYETGSATSIGTIAANLLKAYESGGYPGVGFATSASAGLYGIINFDTATNHRFYFTQRYSAGATYAEVYTLPPATTTMSADAWYDILTTKSAVTIAQGGTGATTAANARTNLAVLGTAGGTMTGTITHKHSSWDVTSPPSSDSSWDIHYVTDKNDKGITFHRIWNKTTNGVMGYEFGVRRQGSSAGTTTLWNTITLDVAADGTRSVGVSDAAAWRTALGLGSNATSSTAYLPLAGGTMTGTLKGTYIQLTNYYQTHSDGGQFVINARTSDGSSHRGQMSITSDNRWYWCEYGTSGTDSTREYYYLPKSTATSGSPEYNILTDKSGISLPRGNIWVGNTSHTEGYRAYDATMSASTTVDTYAESDMFQVYDQDDTKRLAIRSINQTDGRQGIGYTVKRGTTQHGFNLYINASGTRTVYLDDAAAWRTGLGLSFGTSSDDHAAVNVNSATTTTVAQKTLAAGTWLAIGVAAFPVNATGYRKVGIATSTSSSNMDRYSVVSQQGFSATSGVTNQMQVITILKPTASTTYYVNVFQNSGSTLSVTGGFYAVKLV